MASIIRDDGELLKRLQAAYGLFLETRPHLARRAINAEFDKIDLDDAWWSPDAALRRARASVTFLRHAVVLAFGTEDPGDQVLRMLSELTPPADEHLRNAPPSVLAELVKLRRMLTVVEGLFFGQHADVKTVLETGRAELFAVERGDYNALAALASDRSAKSNNLSGEGLPFVVLPPGEQLQSFIDELHRNNGTYLDRIVDMDRVGVLTRLGKYLQDRGYTYEIRRGAFSSSRSNDNDYFVLTFAGRNSFNVDAVTISPWKGEHATFVVRHDCGARLPWHAVLSRTKREAKELGAKRLVFQSKTSHHIDVYEAMLQKITALLECDRHEFDCGETYFDYAQRRHRVRIPDDAVGSGGFEDERDSGPRVEPHRNASRSVVEQVATWFRRLF
ncbi:hypothetical protein CIW49_13700 [Mycolicibacterium sp. P1-18]|nr:hypothetical protein CIW49_13700 [Mycolicibacterium sp. P1-18]